MQNLRTIQEDKEDQELLIRKDQIESKEASPKLTEEDGEPEFVMITVGHCRNTVPKPTYHAYLDMTSMPGMSQKQYEEAMIAKDEIQKCIQVTNGSMILDDDETITIVCQYDSASSSNTLTTKRSALERSPALTKLFKSPDYLAESGTQLEFHSDGVACLQFVKGYLENGPDKFTAGTLKCYATVEITTDTAYDFFFIVQVHKLAGKLELQSLKTLAYSVLYEIESSVTAQDCVNLTVLIFNPGHHFDNAVENWLLEQVNRHFHPLSKSQDWAQVVLKSSNEFKVMWAEITLVNLRPISGTSTTTDEAKASLPILSKSPFKPETEKPLPAEPATAPANIITDFATYHVSSLDHNECMHTYGHAPARSTGDSAKARRVLGINCEGEDLIPGRIDRKKPSGLSKASKSLIGLMKRE